MDNEEDLKEHAKYMMHFAPRILLVFAVTFSLMLIINIPTLNQMLFSVIGGGIATVTLYFHWKYPQFFLNIIVLLIVVAGSIELTQNNHWLSPIQIVLLLFSVTSLGLILFKRKFQSIYE